MNKDMNDILHVELCIMEVTDKMYRHNATPRNGSIDVCRVDT